MRFSFLAIFACLALVAAVACGDDDDDSSPTPDTSASPTEEVSETPSGSTDGPGTPTPEPSESVATIGLKEYSIDPEVTSVKPGQVTFKVENNGEIEHEFLVIRTDLPHAQLPRLADNSGADESQLDIIGRVDPIQPDGEQEMTVDLPVGNYVLICNLNTDGRSHYLSGMYDRFVVSDDAPEQAPTE